MLVNNGTKWSFNLYGGWWYTNLADSLLGRVATPSGSWWPGREESGTFCSLDTHVRGVPILENHFTWSQGWTGWGSCLSWQGGVRRDWEGCAAVELSIHWNGWIVNQLMAFQGFEAPWQRPENTNCTFWPDKHKLLPVAPVGGWESGCRHRRIRLRLCLSWTWGSWRQCSSPQSLFSSRHPWWQDRSCPASESPPQPGHIMSVKFWYQLKVKVTLEFGRMFQRYCIARLYTDRRHISLES